MKLAAIAFTEAGKELIERIKDNAPQLDIVVIEKSGIEDCFTNNVPLLFVGACGIAVRLIAPYMKDKLTDPPVVVMDEAGEFVIPILSGHVGGANDLARKLSEITGATPVITTATDVNDTFSVDEFARDNHLTIRNKEKIKNVSSKVLKGEPIRIAIQDFPPEGDCDVVISDEKSGTGLWLSPKRYVLGIGCRKGKTCGEIEALVDRALAQCGIDYSDIRAFGSIDIKADEEGLLDFSRKHRIPFVTFSAEMLMKAKGEFTASEFVKETTGVDNVCERAAALLTENRGEPVLKKMAADGVTVAVSRR